MSLWTVGVGIAFGIGSAAIEYDFEQQNASLLTITERQGYECPVRLVEMLYFFPSEQDIVDTERYYNMADLLRAGEKDLQQQGTATTHNHSRRDAQAALTSGELM